MPFDDDDTARRAAKGSSERMSAVPMVPSRLVPPRPPVRVPMSAPETDDTPLEPVYAIKARREQTTQVGVAPPAPGSAPQPGHIRSVSPPPWATKQERAAIARDALEHGYDVVEPPVSQQTPATATPVTVHRPAFVPWYLREDGVAKVLGALGALVAAVLGALVTYRATQPQPPPPPPPADIVCPPFADQGAARVALCVRINQLEGALGTAQAKLSALEASRERDQKLNDQEPPRLVKKK